MAKNIFINRKKELEVLTNGLRSIKDYVLIAPRRYGKTALALKVLNELKQNDNFIIIDIDLMPYSGSSIKAVAEGIIEKSLNAIGIMGKLRLLLRQVDFSLNLKLRYQGFELDPILTLFNKNDKDDAWTLLEEALALPEKIALKSKKKVIVFYDEFGELNDFGDRIIKVFRSVIQRHKNVSYLFAGSQESVMSKIFIDKLGAFYRFGELMFLTELNKEDLVSYIQEKYPEMQFDVLIAMLELTNGHPYYSAKILEHFATNKEYYSSISEFYRYITNILIAQEHAYIELQLLKAKERQHGLEILRLIAMGLNPYRELTEIPRQNLLRILTNLELSGHIKKIGRARYNLTDPIIAYYLTQYSYSNFSNLD